LNNIDSLQTGLQTHIFAMPVSIFWVMSMMMDLYLKKKSGFW